MKTPKFWNDKNFISFLLYPVSIIYRFFRGLHVAISSEYKTDMKVFCVGNLTAGGSGKTPVSIKIGKILKDKKIKFAYLSKGYKGKIRKFTKVDLKKHNAEDVGDEPLLLAEIADTFVCHSRRKAMQNLSQNFDYDAIVMDDGFQNPTIHKDINIVVIDGDYGIGNGQLLPSGPLRETIESAVKRASFFVIIGNDKQSLTEELSHYGKKVIMAYMSEKNVVKNSSSKYIAFCGIGRPEKFFNSLRKINYNIIKEISFSDHNSYKTDDLAAILFEAQKSDAKIITTKKDWIKFSQQYRDKIEFLDIEVKFYNNNEFMGLLLG